MYKDFIFREYDIRGVYNKDYDKDFAKDLGKAYAKFASEKLKKEKLSISIGMDARSSSPEIVDSLIEGLNESGVQVLKLGLVTTPISYFSTFHMPEVDGSIMVTGSHNPPEYNGYKISVGKTTIMGQEIQDLKKIIEKKDYIKGKAETRDYDIFPEYLERYKKEFTDLSGIKVSIDCGNGVAGCVVRKMYEQSGLKPNILFEKPDGSFPNHHPDPTVEKNMADLKRDVIEKGSDIGIGFDGDADRIGIVTNKGRFLLGDEIMALIADDILKEHPKAKIIADVKCSDRLFEFIEKRGGEAIMWKTGHSLIKKKVKDENSPFGGELSCHIFFADRNYGYDDALYAGLRIIEILKKTGKSVEELLAEYYEASSTPEIRIDTTEEKKVLIVDKMKIYYKQAEHKNINLIDGIRVSFEDGWALIRASNTQPVLSIRFEAKDEIALKRIQDEAMSVIDQYI